jgi:hypothetical protein
MEYTKTFNIKLDCDLQRIKKSRFSTLSSFIKTYEILIKKFEKPLITKNTYSICLYTGYGFPFRTEILNKLNVQYQKDYGRDFNYLMDDDNYCEQQDLIRELIKTYKPKVEQILNEAILRYNTFNRYICECGKDVRKDSKNKHLKSKHHFNFINGIIKEDTFKCECGIEVLNKNKNNHFNTHKHKLWEIDNRNDDIEQLNSLHINDFLFQMIRKKEKGIIKKNELYNEFKFYIEACGIDDTITKYKLYEHMDILFKKCKNGWEGVEIIYSTDDEMEDFNDEIELNDKEP